ncbi:MAG: InlB B-repeat-containing protein [Clostridia bacterium]|nr:InlB B-repeat-containing protein [Clostridia bacterium]
MKHLKKSLALLLAFVMIFSSMSVAASAADGESATGGETAAFTVKFFRKDSNGNWIETTKAAPGEYVKARAYVSTNYYTHTFTSSLLFDTDFFKAVSVTTDSEGNPTFQSFPQDSLVPQPSNPNYVVTTGSEINLTGSLNVNERYKSEPAKFEQIPFLISKNMISADYFTGKELIYSQIRMPAAFDEPVILTDANDNWYNEYDFIVRNEENAVTKNVDEEGVAVVPKELRGTIETVVGLNLGAMLINVPKGQAGADTGKVVVLGKGWEISDENFKSTEGVISTTSSVLLNANGGAFEGNAEVREMKGIIKDSIYDEITSSEAVPERTNFTLIGWSPIKTARGADVTDEILSAIGYDKMSNEEIAALGWKGTSQIKNSGHISEEEVGTLLSAEVIANLGLADMSASQIDDLGLKVTSEILEKLAIDKTNTKYDYDEYTLYALWDNSGEASYTVETYLMDTNGGYSLEPTQEDIFYTTAGTTIPLQATAKEGFTLDISAEDGTSEKSSESVKVEADGSSVLKAYYARNKYTVTYKYEDNTGAHEEDREVYFDAEIPAFGYLPADAVDLYLVDSEGNKTSEIPEKMPAENIVILAETKIIYLFDAGEGAIFPSTKERTMRYVYKFGATPEIPEEPQKDGYIFGGWDVNIPEKATGSMTFNAMFNPLEGTEESYTVTFYDKNNEVIASSEGHWYGYEFEAVDIPEGYGDNVWKLADGTVVSFPYIIKEDTAFYPVSETANVYNAYFYEDAAEEELFATSPTTYGEEIVAPADEPEKYGHGFKGWSTDPNATEPEALGVMNSMDGKKFYAVFAPNDVTLTFNTDGGTPVADISGKFGDALEEPVTTKPGYTFGGWYDKDGKQVLLPETLPAESAEYTAKWNANTYNVIYKSGNELVGEIQTAKTGETVAVLDGSAVKKEGHTFAGWKSSADNAVYNNPADAASATSFTMPGSDVTLEAQWTVNKHVVSLDANGGAFADGKETFVNDDVAFGTVLGNADPAIPADPEWPTDEKTFKGWADADDTTKEIIYAPGELQKAEMPDDGLNLIAVWEDVTVTKYSATFITADGAFTDADGNEVKEIVLEYEAGEKIIPPVPVRNDGDYIYTWIPSLPLNNIMPAKDMTFVAQWEEVAPGSITYTIVPMIQILNAEGATEYVQGTVLTKTGNEGQTVEITVDGSSESDITWVYSGLTNSPGNIPDTDNAANVLKITLTEGGENELVAYFELAKRDVTLDANGGTFADDSAASQTPLHGETITLPSKDEVTKPGHTLEGWEDSKGNTYKPGDKVSVTGNEKYEAVWKENTYTLTFNEDGGTPDPTNPVLTAGALYNVPAVRKDGFKFNGWVAEDGKVYAAGEVFTMPAADATLTAEWTRVYTVSYTDADGNELKSGIAAEGEDIPVYTGSVPTMEGYRFGGWKNMPEDGKMPASDLVLEPIFNKIYTLTYKYETEDSSLPALPEAEELIAGEETTVKALPEKEGYRFFGWDNDGKTYKPWDTFTMPAKDTELIVTWEEIVEYSLDFIENGGSEVENVKLEAGKEYRLPASTKDGWVLKGWSDGADIYPAGEIYTMPDYDTELNAIWVREITTAEPTTAPTYYISFVYDGEAPEGADVLSKDIPVKGGDIYRLPGLSTVEGIEFDYWYDSNNVKYPKDYEYVVKGNMTFVAKWTEETTTPVPTEPESTEPTTLAKFTLNFDYENGVKPDGAPALPRDLIIEDGQTYTLPALPELEGYEFDGWYDDNGVRYPAGYKYRVTGDVTLFAKWAEKATEPTTEPTTKPTTTEAPKYELSFKHEATTPAGAPSLPKSVELKAGQAHILPELSDFEGYEFKGWKDDKGASYDAGYAFRMPDEATVLYADYEKIEAEPTKYTLSFDENYGTSVDDMELLPGAIINLPNTSRDGYEFIGWDDGENVYKAGAKYEMPTENTTLTAVWEAIPVKSFTVSYAYIGDDTPAAADDVPAEKVITENDMVIVEALPSEVEGYEFFGWYYNGVRYNPGDKFAPASDPIVFEGFWVKNIEKFIVSYEYEGDVPSNADALPEFATYNDGTKVTVALKPSAVEGYTFEGWFLDSDRTTEVTEVTISGADVAIVGVWTVHTNDVVFDANGGTFDENDSEQYVAEDVEFGTDIGDILPEIPKKEGHTFIEWEGMPEDGKMPDEGVELTAKWEINEYTITFDSNGGSNVPSATYEYGAKVSEPSAPTRDKFIFVGWEPSLPETMPANDLTVKAIWKAEEGVKTHKLTADANGGVFADGTDEFTKEYASGDEIGELPTPTRDGYEFKGWDNLPENGKIESDLTVKAIWEKVEPEVKKHTVYYNLVKGEGAEAEPFTTKTFEEGETMTHPAVSVEGFTFKGWTDAEGNPLPETMGTEDINAYAKLEINEYKVTYLLDSTGEVYKEYANVKFASEVPVPADPAKTGYVFAGWEPAVVSTMPAHDLTYTAKWVEAPVVGEKFTARYVVDGKTYDLHVLEEGDAIPVPAAPTKFGFVFVGWEPEVPATMPAENLEFTAQWEVDKTFVGLVIGGTVVSGAVVGTVIGMNAALITGAAIVGGIIVIVGAVHLAKHTHTVTYIVDGEVYKVYKVVEGTKIPVPADPAKDGAEFAGWNPEVPEKMGDTDLVFEATWEDVGADVDVVIPNTGSFAGVAAFAVISGAAAAAYVITRKKKED